MGLKDLTIFFSYVCLASTVTIIPDDYNKAIRPAPKDGSPLEVSFSILVNGIQEINPEKMSIKIHMYLRVSWYDDRLIFPYEEARGFPENNNTNTNTKVPKNVTSFTLNSKVLDSIWVPDHFFKATREVNHFQLLQDFRGFKLYSDLRIFTSSMVEIQVGCPMNFRSFPFDEQRCLISLASYFYSANEIAFKWHELGLSIDETAGDQLGNYDVDLKQENSTVCECKECESFGDEPCLQFTVILKRFDLNNLLGFYIPSALFTGVAWSSVFWPPEVIPGRTVLIITSLLAVSNLYADSRQNSPKTSYVKALDAWMFYSIIASVLSLVQYAIILQWIKKQNTTSSTVVKPTNPSSTFFFDKYKIYQEKTENIGKYGLPIAFVIFNIIYWAYISSL